MEEEFKKLEQESKWVEYFTTLINKSRKHSHDIASTSENLILNRYADVLPYDRSRVKLTRCAGDTDYINANLVTVPKAARQYILTQGPLPETLSHFWLMIWEQKSNVIVMLNKCVEDFVKSEQYWPDKLGGKLTYDDVKLTVTLDKVEIKKHFTVRHMIFEDEESGKSRKIVQFQYTAWPDHDQPDSPTSFLRLLTAIRKSGGLDKMDEPTIVHCSAGIGRSGTFCLIDSILSMVENQGSTEGIDIANTLLEMRDYRMGLIQSPVQLRFAYMSIIYGIKILERANKLHSHMSSMTTSAQQQASKTNGSASGQQTNGKNHRRNKRKPANSMANSPSALNVFNKHLLVEALDDVDSDTADRLFDDSMKELPSLKKARSTAPGDATDNSSQANNSGSNDIDSDSQQLSPEQRAQILTNAINSLLSENTISHTHDLQQSTNPLASHPQSTDSVLIRRRERELRNQRIAEKTIDIKNRMKADEIRRERLAYRITLFKRSALVGSFAILVSSIAYLYFNGNSTS